MRSTTGLREAVGGLAGDLDGLDGRQLAERLQELERLARSLEHTIVAVVGAADRHAVWAEDGHRSVRGWCMATANWSWGETTARLRTVNLLADLPSCDEAFAAATRWSHPRGKNRPAPTSATAGRGSPAPSGACGLPLALSPGTRPSSMGRVRSMRRK